MRSGILLDLMQCEDVDLSHLQQSKFKDIAISMHEFQMAESLICQAK